MKPTVTSTIQERLQSIGQEIMSRTRLEQVIAEFKLYQDEARSKTKEEIIELMRKNIRVEIKGKEGYFTIAYIGEDPKQVAMIANKLSSLFIEENLKLREQQAMGTTEFLGNELESTKAKLEEQEKSITEYKTKHMGELPEQKDSNLKVLEQMQLVHQRVSESLRAAQDRRLMLQRELTELQYPTPSAEEKDGASATKGKSALTYEAQIYQLRMQLRDLQSKYTEKHPDIVTLKRKIADLESKKETQDLKNNPRYRELNAMLAATDMEIKRLSGEEAKARAQINRYRDRIETIPKREQEMASLMREYQSTKEMYASLVQKSEAAQQAENLERRQKGEQFRVIDSARIPEKPFQPDIPMILLLGLGAGLGGGLGLCFLREQMDRSFHDPEDVEAVFGLRVMANIPKITME